MCACVYVCLGWCVCVAYERVFIFEGLSMAMERQRTVDHWNWNIIVSYSDR